MTPSGQKKMTQAEVVEAWASGDGGNECPECGRIIRVVPGGARECGCRRDVPPDGANERYEKQRRADEAERGDGGNECERCCHPEHPTGAWWYGTGCDACEQCRDNMTTREA